MRTVFLIVFMILSTLPPAPLNAESLTVAFNQRPPYHYLDDADSSIPKGLVADPAVKALAAAGLDIQYEQMSARRILSMIKSKEPFCSFGWFKTPERLEYAKFSHGLIQDRPFVVVTKKKNKYLVDKFQTVAELFSDTVLIFGTRAKMSYGPFLDTIVRNSKMQVVAPDNTQINMIKMMDRDRFHFMLLAPEEIEEAFRTAAVDLSNYASIQFADIPKGNIRCIMCSRGVDDETMRKINEAIDTISKNGLTD